MPSTEESRLKSARRKALSALARREHYRAELQRKLEGYGFEAPIVLSVLERLEGEGLLNDQRYVEQFVAQHAARGHGPDLIRNTLNALGFRSEIVGPIVEGGQNWVALACVARSRKFGAGIPGAQADIQEQARYLRQRGFTLAQVRSALDEPLSIAGWDEQGSSC